MRDRADIGSPWEPVEITHTWPGVELVDLSRCRPGRRRGCARRPSCRASATFFPIDRPRVATLRPLAMAASAICWTRWMWLAKQVTMNRLVGRARNTRAQRRPDRGLATAVKPGSSALVESDEQQADARVRGQRPHPGQVGPPAVHRMEVELEVARVEDHALRGVEGGGEAVGHRVGDGDELDVAGADPAALAVARPG